MGDEVKNTSEVSGESVQTDPTFAQLKIFPTEVPTEDEVTACKALQECLELRKEYVFKEAVGPWKKDNLEQGKSDHYFEMQDGVVHVYANKEKKVDLFPIKDATTFFTDLQRVLDVVATGTVSSLCHYRLTLLEQKFNLHLTLNSDRESLALKNSRRRDFYNVRKVDTHIHHSACMSPKHLLRFIKTKLKEEPKTVVLNQDGKDMTLEELFQSLNLSAKELDVDFLDVHADESTFRRFDKFNSKYNPFGQHKLKKVFMNHDNYIEGRYMAEITKQVISHLEENKYQMAEYRISVHGEDKTEWDILARWTIKYNLFSENVTWMIQVPRVFDVYMEEGSFTSFQEMLDNFFIPLFEVVGLDLVDDESKPDNTVNTLTPAQWTDAVNPGYSYYIYYFYASLYTLNKLRESKGMTTIKYRPHSGEAGDVDHLAATFLTSHGIGHGINLSKSPVLQYLYYLTQIGLGLSPLSNNALFVEYRNNPFPTFFQRGLNVSLSTDDPLQFAMTKEPLLEEYSVAAAVWKLSSCDLCEIARNSVYQSGFSHASKTHWLGKDYYKRGPNGNDISKTNVPNIRLKFRDAAWIEEMQQVYLGAAIIPEEVVNL